MWMSLLYFNFAFFYWKFIVCKAKKKNNFILTKYQSRLSSALFLWNSLVILNTFFTTYLKTYVLQHVFSHDSCTKTSFRIRRVYLPKTCIFHTVLCFLQSLRWKVLKHHFLKLFYYTSFNQNKIWFVPRHSVRYRSWGFFFTVITQGKFN